jgi:hypothetical protein
MSFDDNDELGYLWTKIKFVQRYLAKNADRNLEDAEKEFHQWIDGLMESRIERINKMLNAKYL